MAEKRNVGAREAKYDIVLFLDSDCIATPNLLNEHYKLYTDDHVTYLKKIEGTVIYAEDIFQMMAGLDGRPMHFFPDYLVWYEADTGVSTKKKSSFSELLAQDVDRFYAMIQEQYSDNPYVKKQKKVLGLYKIRNL